MDFCIKSINELCNKITDWSHFSPEDEIDWEYAMYSVKDMEYGGFNNDNCKHIGQDMFNKLKKADCRPLKDDILIAKDGSYLKYVFKCDEDLNACILSSIAILRVNKEVINPDYMVYVMRTSSMRNAMASYVSWSALPRIILSDFKKMKMKMVEDKLQQHKIADILLKYDKLIENNIKRIKLLEEMAEEIYKERFVRFRYPWHKNHKMVDSCLWKIPDTFRIVKMNDVFLDYIWWWWWEDDFSEKSPIWGYVIRWADFPYVKRWDTSTCPFRFHKDSNYTPRELHEYDIIIEISGWTSEQPVWRVCLVTPGIIEKLWNKVICASFCKKIELDKWKVSPIYFYYWMNYLYDTKIIDKFQLQSTWIINFKFEYFLRKWDCMLPPKEIMYDFEHCVSPLITEIDYLSNENDKLKEQRDLLLPRLMSWKLEVK